MKQRVRRPARKRSEQHLAGAWSALNGQHDQGRGSGRFRDTRVAGTMIAAAGVAFSFAPTQRRIRRPGRSARQRRLEHCAARRTVGSSAESVEACAGRPAFRPVGPGYAVPM